MPDAMPTGGESVAMNDRSRSRREEEVKEKKLCMGGEPLVLGSYELFPHSRLFTVPFSVRCAKM
jgi:hypothetical protein